MMGLRSVVDLRNGSVALRYDPLRRSTTVEILVVALRYAVVDKYPSLKLELVKLETPILEFHEPIRTITITLSLCGLK